MTRPRSDEGTNDKDEEEDEEEQPQAAESRSVTLKSGGTLTLSATTKFMALSTADCNFVFGLIDELDKYQTTHADPPEPIK